MILALVAQAAVTVSPDGVVQGGWDYVVAAYSISAAVFLFYGVSVALRLRRSEDETK